MQPTTDRLQSHERRILINTCYGHLMSHLNMLVFPAVVLPLTAIFEMDMAGVLAMSFWMYLLFGLTALPWGLAADRWGAGPLMKIFYAGAGLAGISAAVFLGKPSIFVLALAFLGLFSGIYHPTGLGLISKQMTRVGLGMGTNGMFGNLGLIGKLAGFGQVGAPTEPLAFEFSRQDFEAILPAPGLRARDREVPWISGC